MKTIFKSLLYFSFATLVLTSCAKNDDFSVPSIKCTETTLKANQTIDGLYDKIPEGKDVVLYNNDEIVSGIVISNDAFGNFYQQLYIVDEVTQKPLILKIDVSGSYAYYPVGTKIFAKINGTYIQNSFGMITVGGGIYTSSSGSKYPDALAGTKLRSSVFKSCTLLNEADFAKYNNRVSLETLKQDKTLLGKLVTVEKIQFVDYAIGKKYYDDKVPADNDAQGYTLRKLEDEKGNTFVLRTGKYSNGFKDQIVTNGSGSVTGIFTDFQGTLQFSPRTMADMKLDQARFKGTGTVDPSGENEGKDIAGVNQNTPTIVANFENWKSFIAATSTFGLMNYAKEAPNQGQNGKTALAIKGKPAKNDYVFTVENQAVVSKAKSITMFVKGTAGKSLSFNVFKADGSYDVFNLATDAQIEAKDKPVYSSDLVLTATKRMNSTNPKNGNNDYATGSVAATNWMKVTLDLTGVDYNTTGTGALFALKVGSGVDYNLLVTNIVFNEGDGPVDPGAGDFFPANATFVADFDSANITSVLMGGKVTTGTIEKGSGPDGTSAIKLVTNSNKNGFVYTANAFNTPKGKTKLSFYVKGSAVRTLSFIVFDSAGEGRNFNPGDINKSVVLNYVTGNNDYIGTVAANDWVKITLDLSTLEGYQTTDGKNLLSIKFGKDGNWDALISSAFFE